MKLCKQSGVAGILVRGGILLGLGLVGGPGAEPPGFRRIFKKFLKKIAKNALFYHIFQKS